MHSVRANLSPTATTHDGHMPMQIGVHSWLRVTLLTIANPNPPIPPLHSGITHAGMLVYYEAQTVQEAEKKGDIKKDESCVVC